VEGPEVGQKERKKGEKGPLFLLYSVVTKGTGDTSDRVKLKEGLLKEAVQKKDLIWRPVGVKGGGYERKDKKIWSAKKKEERARSENWGKTERESREGLRLDCRELEVVGEKEPEKGGSRLSYEAGGEKGKKKRLG